VTDWPNRDVAFDHVAGAIERIIEEERRRAVEASNRKAEEERQRREQEAAEAKRREQEARRKAEEEERRRAEVEAKRQEEEKERRRAEEATRKAEEERKRREQQEAEARRKAEEEERRRADAEAKRQAEEKERRWAEEEATRKAEEERKRRDQQEAGAKRRAEEEGERQWRERSSAEVKRQAEEEAKREAEGEKRKPRMPAWIVAAAVVLVVMVGAILVRFLPDWLTVSSVTAEKERPVPPSPPADAPKPPPTDVILPRTFRDCDVCPSMVALPGGTFAMGSPESEEGREPGEGPQRPVTIKPFAIGQYEVTFDEWDACIAGDGCNGYRPDDNGWGRGSRPVINVLWRDAQAYVDWLAKKKTNNT
jgi:formylglycine-generating enzyme required for sulfatase activity